MKQFIVICVNDIVSPASSSCVGAVTPLGSECLISIMLDFRGLLEGGPQLARTAEAKVFQSQGPDHLHRSPDFSDPAARTRHPKPEGLQPLDRLGQCHACCTMCRTAQHVSRD